MYNTIAVKIVSNLSTISTRNIKYDHSMNTTVTNKSRREIMSLIII